MPCASFRAKGGEEQHGQHGEHGDQAGHGHILEVGLEHDGNSGSSTGLADEHTHGSQSSAHGGTVFQEITHYGFTTLLRNLRSDR